MQIAAVNREIYDVIVFAVDRLTIRPSICSGECGVLHLMVSVYKCLDDLGQRPIIIIIPIDSHCNLPQNKTHSRASQLIVDPNIFSRRKIAPSRVQVQPKNRGLASIQGRYFSLFRDTPKSLNNEKMIIKKSLHAQFEHCMTKQQLIKSHNIAKYSRNIILSCDKRRLIDPICDQW